MLRQLSIENVAVIERADIEFKDGLNVLTGETGAGKSILIDSINAILGNRTSKEIVRSGEAKAVIWAQFDNISPAALAQLEENGYPCEEGLLIYREITFDGKSICRVNRRPATAAIVREICANLVNIHGQHDNQALLDATRHIEILDSYSETAPKLSQYQSSFEKLVSVKKQLNSVITDDAEKEHRLELLRYQVDEIEKASLVHGEEEELEDFRKKFKNAEKLVDAIAEAASFLDGDDEARGATASIFEAARLLDSITHIDEGYGEISSKLTDAYYALSDISSELADELSSLDYDPRSVDDTEERLDLIYKLKRKYGPDIDSILEHCEKAKAEIQTIEKSDELREQLTSEYKKLFAETSALAQELTALRKEGFDRFSQRILEELRFLNMPGVSLSLECTECPLNKMGHDVIQFFISTNPGEAPKPLSKIASGGELSRIMLAIKNALAEKDDIGTLIFDEIDSGVSGSGAQRIGQKLKEASKTRQIICVTHSAPIAAYSDAHLQISKSVSEQRTYTTVRELSGEERIYELARIISGDNVTDISLSNAKEMLELAHS